MTLTISLPPETEAKLRIQAAATGKDLLTLVREAVEEKLAAVEGRSPNPAPDPRWAAEFGAWMHDVEKRASRYSPGYAADDSRESIYEGRGE